jgi:hypothetical protein
MDELNSTPDGQPMDKIEYSFSISWLWHWFKDRKIKKDLDDVQSRIDRDQSDIDYKHDE